MRSIIFVRSICIHRYFRYVSGSVDGISVFENETGQGNKKKGLLALLGIAAALTYEIKVTVFIIFIAIILDSITRIKDIKEYALKAIIVVVVLTISIVSINKVVSLNIQIDKETAENAKFPLTHWVMMALNDFGGYVQSDVDYTKSYYSYEDKKKANIKEIKKRAKSWCIRHS